MFSYLYPYAVAAGMTRGWRGLGGRGCEVKQNIYNTYLAASPTVASLLLAPALVVGQEITMLQCSVVIGRHPGSPDQS